MCIPLGLSNILIGSVKMSSWKITDPDRTIRYACQMYQRWVFTLADLLNDTYNSTNDNMVQNLKSPVSFIFVFASHLSLHLIAHHRCQVGAMLVAPINVGVMISSRLQAFQFLSTCSFSSPTLPCPPSPWPPGSSCQGLLSGTYHFSIMITLNHCPQGFFNPTDTQLWLLTLPG